MKKTLTLVLAFVLVIAMTVAGTLAYLTDKDVAKNTFTVGNVDIVLEEPTVENDDYFTDDPDLYATDADHLIKRNEDNNGYDYHLLPGHEYIKDPTVTVIKNSEECYVRMLVKIDDFEDLKAIYPKSDAKNAQYWKGDLFLIQNFVPDWDPTVWLSKGLVKDTTNIYEFWYKETVEKSDENQTLPALFTKLVVPTDMTAEQLATLDKFAMTATADAIQADGFADAAAAWAKFDGKTEHDTDAPTNSWIAETGRESN